MSGRVPPREAVAASDRTSGTSFTQSAYYAELRKKYAVADREPITIHTKMLLALVLRMAIWCVSGTNWSDSDRRGGD